MSGIIILIGYRGVGKTSIGRRLAQELGFAFFDTDREVEKIKGMSINSIVESEGWQAFRECERRVVRSLGTLRDTVVATGGGAVMHEADWREVKEDAMIIWLTADPKVIVTRIVSDKGSKNQRPSLTNCDLEEETVKLLEQRHPIYRRLAEVSVDTGNVTIEETVMRLILIAGGKKE